MLSPRPCASAHDGRSIFSRSSRRSSGSDRSDVSHRTQSTIPTEYDRGSTRSRDSKPSPKVEIGWEEDSPRTSAESFASTVPSLPEGEGESGREDDFHLPDYRPDTYHDDSIPTTPSDFGMLFPSDRTLNITHDDSTPDGNMNLKVNTKYRTKDHDELNMTLFHLRMYDLKKREFSLRRYDRNSGREVCHSSRRASPPADDGKTPVFQRTLTSALSTFRTRSDNRMTTLSTLGRPGSRNASRASVASRNGERPQTPGHDSRTHAHLPTNTTRLEFSNYSKVEVKRRGTKSSKRYECEYWAKVYRWRRVVQKTGKSISTSFLLEQAGSDQVLASIVPEPLSPTQWEEERRKGGWIPPCRMWIDAGHVTDLSNDLADVIVATGLIALVDDCIKRRFHGNQVRRPSLVASSMASVARLHGHQQKHVSHVDDAQTKMDKTQTRTAYPAEL